LDSFLVRQEFFKYNIINQKFWGKICSKLASCHKINVTKSEIFLNSMAGGIKFSPRHLTFLGLDGKNYKIQENNEELSNWIKSIFELYYFNSYDQNNPDFSLENLKKEIYEEFKKNDNFNEFDNIEEDIIEEEVRNVLEDLSQIQKSNEQNVFSFNFSWNMWCWS